MAWTWKPKSLPYGKAPRSHKGYPSKKAEAKNKNITSTRSRSNQKDRKVVLAALNVQYPGGCSPLNLPFYDPPGSFWILPPKNAPQAKHPHHPPFLFARFSSVITARGQKALVKAWDGLNNLSLNVRHYISRSESNRSTTPAYHFGISQIQQPHAVVTCKTKIQVLTIKFRAHRFIKTWNKVVKEVILKRHTLDFDGAFFTLAIKEGTSEIDWNDDLNYITWLIPLGDWEGRSIVWT
ncbi:hypothetical protein P692DRAFT_20821837 [Suillus brevipes Sb2]|nr:hypothetical protein P692DRAFT_20821837 [Suillus brevipes Sb2]